MEGAHAAPLLDDPARLDATTTGLASPYARDHAGHPGRHGCEEQRMVRSIDPFVVRRGEGEVIPGPAGGGATLKARTETTGGSFTLIEIEIGPKQGPPQHRHRREDEMWYILDGSFRFIADGELFDAPPGAFVFVPRGTAHCFQNLDERPGHLLVMFTPSGMERFFEEHAMLPPGPVDPERYREIAERSWMDVTGPPLAESHPL
jgi:quercetin dioxygenase-like cupin family protein